MTRIFSSAVSRGTQKSYLGLVCISHHRLQFFFINWYLPSRRKAGNTTALLHTCKIGRYFVYRLHLFKSLHFKVYFPSTSILLGLDLSGWQLQGWDSCPQFLSLQKVWEMELPTDSFLRQGWLRGKARDVQQPNAMQNLAPHTNHTPAHPHFLMKMKLALYQT